MTRLVVSGEIDLAAADRVREAIAAAAQTPTRLLLIDVTAVEFIDSSGLRALVEGSRAARSNGRRVELAITDGPVTRLLELTGTRSQFLIAGE
jgi:anti-sigma B factor antagonist